MAKIQFKVRLEELGCVAENTVDVDDDPEFLAQFDTRGEAIEQAVIDMAEQVAAKLREIVDNHAHGKALLGKMT